MDAALDAELHARLAARIAAVSGIRVPVAKRWLLASRVTERMRAAGYADVGRYVEDIVSGQHEDELGRLVESVRVGETHFFRHEKQLRAIARVALPEIVARREADAEKKVHVWSAGCATGEEPYTIAMLLASVLSERSVVSWDVLATDLSEPALAIAAQGRYPAGAAASVPKAIAAWALVTAGDEVVVSERLRAHVRFEAKNLLDAAYPRGFDLVLCRNVLIYFDRATQASVVKRLARSVVPGGWLALGYAEHVAELDDAGLVPLRTEDGLLYRRAVATDGEQGARIAKVARTRARPAASGVTDPRPARPAASGVTTARPAASGVTDPRPARPASSGVTDPRPARPASRGVTEPRPRPTPGAGTKRGTPAHGLRRSIPPGRKQPAPATGLVLDGELVGAPGLTRARMAASALLADDHAEVHLDLRALQFADDDVARLLARAAATIVAAGRKLVVHVGSAGGERFLRRHSIVPPAELAP